MKIVEAGSAGACVGVRLGPGVAGSVGVALGRTDGAVEAVAAGSVATAVGEAVGVGEHAPASSARSVAPVSTERSLIGAIVALGSPTSLDLRLNTVFGGPETRDLGGMRLEPSDGSRAAVVRPSRCRPTASILAPRRTFV